MTMASDSDSGITLSLFKAKISECLDMVGSLEPRDRIQAVEIWNEISEQLQQAELVMDLIGRFRNYHRIYCIL